MFLGMSGQGSGAPSDHGGGPSPVAGASDLIGATLGNYRIVGLLGVGGMGRVYLGEHLLIGRKVAVKVLDPQIADNPEVISRFFVEARAVNEIRHPNIVEVTDLGTHQGRPFIIMEHLSGETLEARLGKQRQLPPEETVRIARQVASALGAAHARGMVHRDLKPANIMLCDHQDYPDFVKVLDFGIAKLLGASTPVEHHTEVGTVLGTPAYMSPEQCLGDAELDHRSDVYSFGVILFLMLSGRLPFQGDTFGRLIISHVHEPAPKLALVAPSVPATLAAAVDRTLAKKPEDRFAGMKELRLALERALGEAVFPRSLTPVGGLPVGGLPAAGGAKAALAGARPTGQARAAALASPSAAASLAATLPLGSPAAGGGRDARRLEEAVGERLGRGQIAIPPLPTVYAQCLDLLRDQGVSFAAVAALVKQDGRLASLVVRRANSDGNAGRGVATTAEQAITRLGARGARAAIIELGARRVIEARNERLEDEVRRPWQHALATAIVAERLTRLQGLDERASEAHLAGLLKDIGVPLVATTTFEIEWELTGKRGQQAPAEIWWPIVRLHHRQAAALLVQAWGLPEELGQAVRDAGSFQPAAGWSLSNVACLAGALADREGFYLRRDALEGTEAVIDGGTRTLALGELKVRRSIERLKEAVRLRE